jgi:hypothetical protein
LWRGAAGGGGAITGTVAAGGDGPAGKQHESLTALVQTCNNFTFTKTMQGQYRLSVEKHATWRYFVRAKKTNG